MSETVNDWLKITATSSPYLEMETTSPSKAWRMTFASSALTLTDEGTEQLFQVTQTQVSQRSSGASTDLVLENSNHTFATAGLSLATSATTGALTVSASDGPIVLSPEAAETARFDGDGGLTLAGKHAAPPTTTLQGSLWVYSTTTQRPYFKGGHVTTPEQRPLVQGPLAPDPSTTLVADNRIARFDGTTGGLVQESLLTIDDSGNQIFPNSTFIYWNNSSSNTRITGSSSGYLTLKGSSGVEVDATTLTLDNGYSLLWGGSSATSIVGSSAAGGDLTLNAADEIFLNADDDVVIQVNGSTYATFDGANQRLGVGTTTPDFKFDVEDTQSSNFIARVNNLSTGSGADVLALRTSVTTAGTGNRFLQFSDATQPRGYVNGDGSGGVNYASNSDARLKTALAEVGPALDVVKALKVWSYTGRFEGSRRMVGFLAQELQELWPYAVAEVGERNERKVVQIERVDAKGVVEREERLVAPAALDAVLASDAHRVVRVDSLTEDHPEFSYLGVDYGRVTPLLAKAMQEQQALIEALQAQVAQQHALIAALAARLEALERR